MRQYLILKCRRHELGRKKHEVYKRSKPTPYADQLTDRITGSLTRSGTNLTVEEKRHVAAHQLVHQGVEVELLTTKYSTVHGKVGHRDHSMIARNKRAAHLLLQSP